MPFQSLFWWKYCPGAGTREGRFPSGVSFNPCSGGSIALGISTLAKFLQSLRFQSLFWWKYCPGPTALRGPPTSAPCFNPCSGGSIALGDLDGDQSWIYLVFQSLFWWKYCPGVWPVGTTWARPIVSILVLVEVLPWGKVGAKSKKPPSEGFNPCSGGSIALGSNGTRGKRYDRLFQSLFWWKYCPGSILCISFEIATGYMNRLRLKILI